MEMITPETAAARVLALLDTEAAWLNEVRAALDAIRSSAGRLGARRFTELEQEQARWLQRIEQHQASRGTALEQLARALRLDLARPVSLGRLLPLLPAHRRPAIVQRQRAVTALAREVAALQQRTLRLLAVGLDLATGFLEQIAGQPRRESCYLASGALRPPDYRPVIDTES